MGESGNDSEAETQEMLKALYDFKATFAKTLSFHENDLFILHHSNTKQRNWWQVINEKGQVGYVPSNYVTAIQVSPHYWVEFLNGCLEALNNESAKSGGSLPSDRQDLLQKLMERRRLASIMCTPSKRRHAPVPPDFSDGAATPIQSYPDGNVQPTISATSYVTAPALLQTSQKSASLEKIAGDQSSSYIETHTKLTERKGQKHSRSHAHGQQSGPKKTTSTPVFKTGRKTDGQENDSLIALTPQDSSGSVALNVDTGSQSAYMLVDQVRRHTQLSHELSRVAVAVVIAGVRDLVGTTPELISSLSAILESVQGPLKAPAPLLEDSHDARRLRLIFSELTQCKEDSQQRSWMLYEDEATIIEYIKELTSILNNADAAISRHIVAADQYSGVSSLAQYYQMETRWSIRQLLLQAFGVICSLDATAQTLLLNSVLPMELARDMRSNPRNMPRLNYSSLLLTMLFSMGEPIPITHLEHLGEDFITFLFDLMESPPDTDVEEQIPDLFLNLILSYNLQFKSFTENIMLKSLLKRSIAKTFTEKILLLLNREEDPVRVFEHKPAPPHSVLKLFIDLFSNDRTATLFYTNDTKVLIDIIVRQLADLSPGDNRRRQYLELCRLVMRNTPYHEHHHRRDELLKCFTRIFCEETDASRHDQQLVREISNEFPQYFKA
ncbi:hypothetical protein R5R35_005422 [Gryllus longicercus]|uniref:SH3 domain-containing protein n=1 Tax=Gryllus longicercus TaxID=2509291 RepID=A0AAN9V5C3_9ORTH